MPKTLEERVDLIEQRLGIAIPPEPKPEPEAGAGTGSAQAPAAKTGKKGDR